MKPSRLCPGMFLSKEELGNVWLIGLVHIVHPYSFVKILNNSGKITITEKVCHPILFKVFHVLLFNGDVADSYEYPQKRDKVLMKLLSLILLIPPIFLAFVFIFNSFAEPIDNGLSSYTLITWLLCLVFIALFLFAYRNFSGLAKFGKSLKKSLLDSRHVVIYNDRGWFIKYTDLK